MALTYLPLPGTPVHDLDTPALIVDLDIAEANILKMQAFANKSGVALRPHVKNHKSPYWARKQIAAGAIGVCVAKVSEAEVMAEGGIGDIFVANEIVTAPKISRLMSVAARAKVAVAVDTEQNLKDLSAAAQKHGVELGVLVDVNVRINRCGVEPGAPAVALARKASGMPGIRFEGFMGYEGHIAGAGIDPAARKETIDSLDKLLFTVRAAEDAGIPVKVVSSGGTSTYTVTGAIERVTEIQAGSYIFMDGAYLKEMDDFTSAMTVLGTVISRPTADKAILDCGLKSVSNSSGQPRIVGTPGAEFLALNAEHGHVKLEGEARKLKVGDKVHLLPMHGESTINIHNEYFCIRKGVLEAVIPVAARGMFR
ncbi:MAG: DSD1 family PLP-dependent enzyme [Dehalococcoidia bacterium]|nr:DSD1 family PLP-dependent enzyme [Dehalococcoidia bacterium]